MDVRLNKLSVRNFKGLADFEFYPGGADTSVFGRNGAGKTTLADAYFWLMCGCDSEGRGQFSAITLDAGGNEKDNLDADVTAELSIDGKALKLQKIHKQRWVKMRGKAMREFSGHTTCYYIDGVKLKKKDYEDRISSITDPKTLRMISDLGYFVERMKPEDRRTRLMDLAEIKSDDEIISETHELSGLPDILEGRPIDQAKIVIRGQLTKLNDQLDDIPKLIAEHKGQMPDISGLNKDDLTGQLEMVIRAIDGKRRELSDIENGFAFSKKRAEINEAELEFERLKQAMAADKTAAAELLNKDVLEVKERINATLTETVEYRNQALSVTAEMDRLNDSKQRLGSKWQTINRREFPTDEKCPTCGQIIPPDMINVKKAMFYREKNEEIEKINVLGRDLSAQIAEKDEKIRAIHKRIDENQRRIDQLTKDTESLTEKINLRHTEIEKKNAARIDANQSLRAALEQQFRDLSQNVEPEKQKINQAIAELSSQKADLEKLLRLFDHAADKEKRIKELHADLKAAALTYEALESHLFLIEKFLRIKAEMIEASVSRHFAITSWKLFEPQINGGFRDICEPCRNGIKYSTDLNHGSKINVGLDIINTFSRHFKTVLPVWIDGAESLTELIPSDNQLIKLVVDDKAESLSVAA